MKKICIVTPKIFAHAEGADIAIACQRLAKFIHEDTRAKVDILYTGENNDSSEFTNLQNDFSASQIELFSLYDLEILPDIPLYGGLWFPKIQISLRIMHWLKNHHYDLILFQDISANGYHTIQAKKTNLAFRNTTLCTLMHSPSYKSTFAEGCWFTRGKDDLINDYCEHYVIENSDKVISFSQELIDWTHENNWAKTTNYQILPYPSKSISNKQITTWDQKQIIFLGKLSTSCGLEPFIQAIQKCVTILKKNNKILHIEFVGTIHQLINGDKADDYINDNLRKYSDTIHWKITTQNIYHTETLDYISQQTNVAIFTPSLADQFSPLLIDCLSRGCNLFPSMIGSRNEMFQTDNRNYRPVFHSIYSQLEKLLHSEPSTISFTDFMLNSRLHWKKFIESCLSEEHTASASRAITNQFLTVCIPYYNSGAYLPETLKALEAQSLPKEIFTVILVNDGSNDALSLEIWEKEKSYYSQYGWQFISQENCGPDATRNFAARSANTKYIVYVDSDNLPMPHMLETMLSSIEHSKYDILTCHMQAFADGKSQNEAIYYYAPIGPSLANAVFDNVLGDTNFIAVRDNFLQHGGFNIMRGTNYEDFEVLIKMAVAGLRIDVIPQFLCRYRHVESSFHRSSAEYGGQRRALSALLSNLPHWQQSFIFTMRGTVSELNERCHYLEKRVRYLERKNTPVWKKWMRSIKKRIKTNYGTQRRN